MNDRFTNLYNALDRNKRGYTTKAELLAILASQGIRDDDPRLQQTLHALEKLTDSVPISLEGFNAVAGHNLALIERCIQGRLIIPKFSDFITEIVDIYEKTRTITSGKVADYIPELKSADPKKYGISICTIDGQRFSLGDSTDLFSMQSICKPINYCLALEEHGESGVHQYIGREPSGHGFNELTLNKRNLPHNPMINAGAILACALIRPDLTPGQRLQHIMHTWEQLSAVKPSFSDAVYASERQTADRNFALGYFMREKKAFPPGADLLETLELYFQCCSIETNCESLAVAAASLANSGICPITEERVFAPNTVKDCLSLMFSCGMYDLSGEYAFTVGLPAKSGVSGGLMLVIPKTMGIAIWSPPLEKLGNSVRALEFSRELVNRFNFHNFDSTLESAHKKDPRLPPNAELADTVTLLCWAASQDDLTEISRLIANGVNLNACDYDGRTALHLASANGHIDTVAYLLQKGVSVNLRDRWDKTPLDDAYEIGFQDVINLLEAHGGVRGGKRKG